MAMFSWINTTSIEVIRNYIRLITNRSLRNLRSPVKYIKYSDAPVAYWLSFWNNRAGFINCEVTLFNMLSSDRQEKRRTVSWRAITQEVLKKVLVLCYYRNPTLSQKRVGKVDWNSKQLPLRTSLCSEFSRNLGKISIFHLRQNCLEQKLLPGDGLNI